MVEVEFDVAHVSKVMLQRFWRGECHQKQLDGTTCIFSSFLSCAGFEPVFLSCSEVFTNDNNC